MSDLRDLYQELILDHQKRPRNFRKPERYNHEARGMNPLCGDQLTLFVLVEDGKIADVGFDGSGCAISKASASMMTERLKGKTLEEAQEIFHRFHEVATAREATEEDQEILGKLAVFSGVREFPARVKCATLSWHTLQAALQGGGEVSTE